MNSRPGIDSTCLLIARRWVQEDCCDSTTFVNQQFAIELQKSGFGVLSTVLEATDDEKDDAKTKNITLVLPKGKRSYKIDKSDWLMFPDRYYGELKKYRNVLFIVGHVNENGYDTVEEACIIRDRYFEQAKLVLFIHHIPVEKGFGSAKVIGERDILQYANTSALVIVVGYNLNSYYLTQLGDGIVLYLPAPDERYLESKVKLLPEDANIEMLSVVNVSDEKNLQCCNLMARAIGKVTSRFASIKKKPPSWKLCHMRKNDIKKNQEKILNNCGNLENLKTTEVSLDGDIDYLFTIFKRSALLLDTSTDLFTLTGLNAIAAGLPVLFDCNSSIANFLTSDDLFEKYCNDILVQVAVNESSENAANKWAKSITNCVAKLDIAFERAFKLREGLIKSVQVGLINKSHKDIITWLRNENSSQPSESDVNDCQN